MNAIDYLQPQSFSIPGGHYSHAVVANGLLFIAGQLPVTSSGRKLTDASFERQVEQVLANVDAILGAAGCARQDLVQVRVYIDAIEHWPAFDALYALWAGNARPARAVVPTGPLHFGLQVEVEAVARIPA
jgi:reactive intermediate/imine deaminase